MGRIRPFSRSPVGHRNWPIPSFISAFDRSTIKPTNTLLKVLLIFLGLCVKRARKRIDQNQEHMLALLNGGESDAPHFYTNEARVSEILVFFIRII